MHNTNCMQSFEKISMWEAFSSKNSYIFKLIVTVRTLKTLYNPDPLLCNEVSFVTKSVALHCTKVADDVRCMPLVLLLLFQCSNSNGLFAFKSHFHVLKVSFPIFSPY